ncbi:MAG: acetyl-CoA carboxylase biotin carboxyl carrier protein [Chloroflexi bacterium]|nr:acetyl-CoA carboxylase biotin carboxyl carrier protein [Chloroflexota bacterium]
MTQRDADPEGDELLALVDRLGRLIEGSELAELEVEADGTRVLLRRSAGSVSMAVASDLAAAAPVATERGAGSGPQADAAPDAAPPASGPAVVAVISPLTGIFYASPAPGSAPYVRAGGEVAVGQVIGLVEAMKLFNEIKSNVAGRVVRVVAETGALVKAKQALIEVEPL